MQKRKIHSNAVLAINKELSFSFHMLNDSYGVRQKIKKKRRQENKSLMKKAQHMPLLCNMLYLK